MPKKQAAQTPRIDEDMLLRVAKNARVSLSKAEEKQFLREMQEVLAAFSRIDEMDTAGVAPAIHPIQIENVFREDKTATCLASEAALSLTSHKKGDYFKGPRVV